VSKNISIDKFDCLPTLHELKNILHKLKNDKAAGPDGLKAEFFKYASETFHNQLLEFYSFIWEFELVPKSFLESLIVPLYKTGAGDQLNLSNYRGICLQNIIYKIFANLILLRLQSWVDENNFINESQAGFRKGYSTIDNIYILNSLIDYSVTMNKPLYAFFIDYKAAFDSISWEALFYKLNSYNIPSKLIRLLKCIYEGAHCRIRLKEGNTELFYTKSGVKQGCVLSPLLFSLFLNDLDVFIDPEHNLGVKLEDNVKIRLLKFADDIVIITHDPKQLQHMIDKLEQYNNLWIMNLNLSKSKIIVFKNKKVDKSLFRWTYKQERIEIVDNYKYLGYTFTYNNDPEYHFRLKLDKVKQAVNVMLIRFFPQILRIFNIRLKFLKLSVDLF